MIKYVGYDIVFSEVPNETTLAFNISNCPNRCVGCHSPYLMDDIGEYLNQAVLQELLLKYKNNITCVCFMGGDAFVREIEQLAIYLNNQNIFPVKIAWYSGKETLPEDFPLKYFNYIKLGGYKKELGGLKSKQTNQKLYRINKGEELVDITYYFWD